MKRRFFGMLVVALLATGLAATSIFAAVSVFATGMAFPQAITRAPSGDFFVTGADKDGSIWTVPAGGGTATMVASAGYSLRDHLLLPAGFGSVGGQLLVVGGGATGSASTMDTSSFAVTPFASHRQSLWTTPVLADNFGELSGFVLVTNQGHGRFQFSGSVDFFAPDGTVGTLTTLPSVTTPYGAALAPGGFGDVGGTLLVSDAQGPGIYSVDPSGQVRNFTTIPLGRGLRQMAFAPKGWGPYSGNLFVSLSSQDIVVVNQRGAIIGRISGQFSPRGLLFTTISGDATLLFSDTSQGTVRRAGPEDVVRSGSDGT
jgi:uncharacterized membrane protein YphA (DoxX/SURF4 family)